MDTKLIGKPDICKPIAKNILQGNEQAHNSFSHDGYPNLSDEEFEQVPIRDITWFVNQIGSLVFVTSTSYTGLVEINDHGQAKELCNSQTQRYRFLTLTQRAKQALGDICNDQSLGFQEPELDKIYLLAVYENGKLQESKVVQYAGLTDNLKFYIFNYLTARNGAGDSCRLLRVGYFPMYQSSSNPDAVTLEQYSPLT